MYVTSGHGAVRGECVYVTSIIFPLSLAISMFLTAESSLILLLVQ